MGLYRKSDGRGYFKEEFYWGGIGYCFDVQNILYSGTSKFQTIQVFENNVLGRVLVLDDIIQTTYFDESFYHGPMAGFSVGVFDYPERVLIVGGGDLGVLHQVLRYSFGKLDLVEIDKKVTEVCREYLPEICKEIPLEKSGDIQLIYEDASEFIRNTNENYQVVIVDSSEPVGPGEPLFGREFYQNVYDRLRSDGIILAQAGSLLYSDQWLKTYRMLSSLGTYRMDVKVLCIDVPTYGGPFALVGARRDKCFPSEGQLIKMQCAFSPPHIGQRRTEWSEPARYRSYQVLPPRVVEMLLTETLCDDARNSKA